MTKADRSRELRYKQPALQSMGYHEVVSELDEIMEQCDEVTYYIDQDSLVEALDGNDDDAWEFQMMFTNLSAKASELYDALMEMDVQGNYDDCTVALIGNRYSMVGFDDMEEDYFDLCSYESELAQTTAGKRLMRMTKNEMISTIGQCFGLLVAFLDLRQQYDYLKATIDILTDENHSILQQVKDIENAYEQEDWSQIDSIVMLMPDRLWVE